VEKNRLVDSSGQAMSLRGVNRMGSEYACIQGWGFFDGPIDDASIDKIKAWNLNTVRIPLNEDCWLGINGALPAYSGQNYQSAIAGFVDRLTAKGMHAILDLHWTAAGTGQSTKQTEFADADHSPSFWGEVAVRFAKYDNVLFDLFNEPFNVEWPCWRDGCMINGYQAVGFQKLVDTVRKYANNTIMLGGRTWSNDLTGFLTYAPKDPINNLAASWHSYNFNACINQGCWDSQIAPVAAKYPVVVGEFGENDCNHGYIDTLLPWMESHGLSYVAWTWNTANCAETPALISNYDGTPTNFGVGYKNFLAAHVN